MKTGKRKWHYQFVHHDIWDYDTPMAPNLLDVTIDGRPRKIIAQTTKQGWVYVLDRVTGEPIWPIVETPVLQSEVRASRRRRRSRFRRKPAPYAQQGLARGGSHRLHAGDQGLRAQAGEAMPHGTVLHSRVAGRRQGEEWTVAVQVLVVCARRERRREHRRRRGGRPGDRNALRRRAERHEHDRGRRRIRAPSFDYSSPHDSCGSSARSSRRRATSRRRSGERGRRLRALASPHGRSAASRSSSRRRWAASRRTT